MLTPQQYLDIERAAETKSEYYDGQIYAMSGGSLKHAVISAQTMAAFGNALKGGGCWLATSNLRVRVSPAGPFFYPDISVCCGEAQVADDHNDVLLNPRVVFEVLSDSTQDYGRGLKFRLLSKNRIASGIRAGLAD